MQHSLSTSYRSGRSWTTGLLAAALTLGVLLWPSTPAGGQSTPANVGPPAPASTAESWAQAAADREVQVIEEEGSFPLSYHVRKIDDRGDTTREIIESKEGTVARLVERNGQPLTRQQDEDERQRLNAILEAPEDFLKHHKRDSEMRIYSINLVKQFPHAMVFQFAPGQTHAADSPQVVIDFQPDPKFKPSSLVAELLTGLEGRLWIDNRTHTLLRVQARVIHPVNFGWGVLARIHTGGTVEFEQTLVGENRWVYSRMEDHLEMREVLVHNTQQNVRMSSWNFRLLSSPISFQEAVHRLLALKIPVRP